MIQYVVLRVFFDGLTSFPIILTSFHGRHGVGASSRTRPISLECGASWAKHRAGSRAKTSQSNPPKKQGNPLEKTRVTSMTMGTRKSVVASTRRLPMAPTATGNLGRYSMFILIYIVSPGLFISLVSGMSFVIFVLSCVVHTDILLCMAWLWFVSVLTLPPCHADPPSSVPHST